MFFIFLFELSSHDFNSALCFGLSFIVVREITLPISTPLRIGHTPDVMVSLA